MTDKEFTNKITELAQEQSDKIILLMIENNLKIQNFEFLLDIPTKISKELKFNEHLKIGIFISIDSQKVIYYYKNNEIKPEGYYLLPEGFRKVSIFGTIQEAIKQNTNTPNIKHLQRQI